MDLNRLYFDHQISLLQALSSDTIARAQHEQDAATTASRIGCIQRSLGAAAALDWEQLAGEVRPSAHDHTLHTLISPSTDRRMECGR